MIIAFIKIITNCEKLAQAKFGTLFGTLKFWYKQQLSVGHCILSQAKKNITSVITTYATKLNLNALNTETKGKSTMLNIEIVLTHLLNLF